MIIEHKLSMIDEETRRAYCSHCGRVPIQRKGKTADGRARWRCGIKARGHNGNHRKIRHKLNVPDTCERCGFVAEDKCQIDVHHKDGNHFNDDPGNHQFLCANCHRLITKQEATRKYNIAV